MSKDKFPEMGNALEVRQVGYRMRNEKDCAGGCGRKVKDNPWRVILPYGMVFLCSECGAQASQGLEGKELS